MKTLILRKVSPCDCEFAYSVKKAAFREYVEKVWGWNEAEQRDLHERRFQSQNFRILEVAGKEVGILASVVEPSCIKVNQLYILPEHQGKHIGRECMSLILEEARQLDLPVRLKVLKVNPRAAEFYRRLEFENVGETDTHIVMEWIA